MAADKIPDFNYNLCIACSICSQDCPESCIEADNKNVDKWIRPYPRLDQPQDCTGCSICSRNCPMEAIVMVERT